MYVDKRLDGVQCVQTLSRLEPRLPGQGTTYVLDFVNHAEDVLAAFKVYYEGAYLTQASDPNIVFDQWDKLAGRLDSSTASTSRHVPHAYWGDGTTKPSQGKLSAALAPVKERFNAAYRRALQNRDNSETDRLDTFRRDLRTFVSTYDFLAAIVDYEDIELEKRATFARLLAEALKDSNRHEESIDLSDVTLTHHALHRRPEQELNLGTGQPEGLASVLAAGSRGRHEAELVPWSEVLAHINTLFEGDGHQMATRCQPWRPCSARCLRTRTCVLKHWPTTRSTSSPGRTSGTRSRRSLSRPPIASSVDSSGWQRTGPARRFWRSWAC
ncbi:MAG: hypothetical protein V9E94_20345 [Microthrixaceae bacterium]